MPAADHPHLAAIATEHVPRPNHDHGAEFRFDVDPINGDLERRRGDG